MADKKFVIAGAALLDVLASPVDASVFASGSLPAETIAMTTGGDAMNEACVLASLGADVKLVSKLGEDFAADRILESCRRLGIGTEYIRRTRELPTSINLVLVDQSGERHFITSPRGTLRRFYPEDLPEQALENGAVFCFASIFVAPAFDHAVLRELFLSARERGMTVCADMTKRKNGETLEEMRDCLACLDYIFPNYEEAALLTGLSDWEEIADAFLDCGVGTAVIKAGAKGCFLKTRSRASEGREGIWVPACKGVRCVDTTGAGDTFTDCFLYALSRGCSLKKCGQFANAGASLCVERVGAPGEGFLLPEILERAGFRDEKDCAFGDLTI